MTMTTTTVVAISVAAVVVVYALWVGIPLWMVLSRDEHENGSELPEYLRIDHDHLVSERERERELIGSGR
jgi:hypothetical protein